MQCVGTHLLLQQGEQRKRDHRVNANLGFLQFQPTHTGFFFFFSIWSSPSPGHIFLHLVIEERNETNLPIEAHTIPIISEGISDSKVQGAPFYKEDSKLGQRAHQKSLGKTEFRKVGPVPSSSASWRMSLCLEFYHIASLYFISLMRSLPFGFHFVIKQLNYNVTSDFAVQNEGGSKQNSFSQWGLVDASQQLKIKNSQHHLFLQ